MTLPPMLLRRPDKVGCLFRTVSYSIEKPKMKDKSEIIATVRHSEPEKADSDSKLTRFGFSFERGGAHSSRTIMLDELETLFSFVDRPDAARAEFLQAINESNCLGKRSGKTRLLTYRHLVDLYALDPGITIYRAMRFFWQRDPASRSMIALLCAYARDSILRPAANLILSTPEGSIVTRESVEELIDGFEQGRFSKATLKSTAQNINSSFTKSGHLHGRKIKVRTRAVPTAASVAFALFLGYLSGERGGSLFYSEYARLLDCSYEKAIELAEEASRKGWIVFKRLGNVIEALFPGLLNHQEMEWLRE